MSIPIPVGTTLKHEKRWLIVPLDDMEVPASTKEEVGSLCDVQWGVFDHGVWAAPMYTHPQSTIPPIS